MGNKLDYIKVENALINLSEKRLLINEFDSFKTNYKILLGMIGVDFNENKEKENTIIDILVKFSEDSFLTLINNMILFIKSENGSKQNQTTSLDLILISISAMNRKYKNLKEIIFFSINEKVENILNKESNEIDFFPFNLLYLCLDLISEEKSKIK